MTHVAKIFIQLTWPAVSLPQLAPSLPLQEDFVYHWKAITHYYIETSGEKDERGHVIGPIY